MISLVSNSTTSAADLQPVRLPQPQVVDRSVSEGLEVALKHRLLDEMLPEAARTKLAQLAPHMLAYVSDLESQGKIAQAERVAEGLDNLTMSESSIVYARMNPELLLGSKAYEFYLERILTEEVFSHPNARVDHALPATRLSGNFRDYISKHFNGFVTGVHHHSAHPVERWLDAIQPMSVFLKSSGIISHLVFDLFRSPGFNPDLFQPKNHDKLLALHHSLRGSYNELTEVFGSDSLSCVRRSAAKLAQIMTCSKSNAKLQKALEEIAAEWSSLAAEGDRLSDSAPAFSFKVATKDLVNCEVVRQGEILLRPVSANAFPIKTLSATNCIIVKAAISKGEAIDSLVLAHIDPPCPDASITSTFRALSALGDLHVELYGGSLFNLLRTSQLLREQGVLHVTFKRPQVNYLTGAGKASYSAVLEQSGQISIFKNVPLPCAEVNQARKDDTERVWAKDKSLRWRVEA